MTRVYVADARPEECSALRLLLLDLKMEVVGEAADWFNALVEVPIRSVDILLVDWDLLPNNAPNVALAGLRTGCPSTVVIVLIGHLDAHKQAALSIGADVFISKSDSPERVAEHLRTAAASVPTAISIQQFQLADGRNL
jgi:DNA-binding NarL/FixJ family response regulator